MTSGIVARALIFAAGPLWLLLRGLAFGVGAGIGYIGLHCLVAAARRDDVMYVAFGVGLIALALAVVYQGMRSRKPTRQEIVDFIFSELRTPGE